MIDSVPVWPSTGCSRPALRFTTARVPMELLADDAVVEATAPQSVRRFAPPPLRRVDAAAGRIAPLGGDVAFGRFASSELVVVAAVLMSFFLLSQFADAVIATTVAFHGWAGRLLRQMMGLRNGSVRRSPPCSTGCCNWSWWRWPPSSFSPDGEINTDDIFDTMSTAFFSFTIGQFNISLSAIFGALVVLLVGVGRRDDPSMARCRFLQATTSTSRRRAIRTGVGYHGALWRLSLAVVCRPEPSEHCDCRRCVVRRHRLRASIHHQQLRFRHHPSCRATDQGGGPYRGWYPHGRGEADQRARHRDRHLRQSLGDRAQRRAISGQVVNWTHGASRYAVGDRRRGLTIPIPTG